VLSSVPHKIIMNTTLLNKKIIYLSCGGYHCCGISNESLAYCWGRNS
jgi:alpha-tubulin suppressor-like RCC1 family protein